MSSSRLLNSTIGFLITLFYIWKKDWTAADIVWVFWLSSLLYGFMSWLLLAYKLFVKKQGSDNLNTSMFVRAMGFLFISLFFFFHFGLFHLVHSIFLNGFFPVNIDSDSNLYYHILTQYFFLAMVTVFSNFEGLVKIFESADNGMRSLFADPYKNVISIHISIFLMIPLTAMKYLLEAVQFHYANELIAIALVLFYYYIIPAIAKKFFRNQSLEK